MTSTQKILLIPAAALLIVAGAATILGLQKILAPPRGSQSITQYGDWRLTCLLSGKTLSVCGLNQDIVTKPSGKTIMRLALGRGRADGMLVVTVPHEILLQPGLGLTVGKTKVIAAPFETCDQVGCKALIRIDDAMLNAIADNDGGRVVFLDLANKPVSLPYSWRGFTEARSALARNDAIHNSWWGFVEP